MNCVSLFFLVLLFFSLCVCCHSIVGLVVCVCGGVVSLWKSGGGLCCGGRAVVRGGVCTPLMLWCVSRGVCDGSACLVLSCCVLWWNDGARGVCGLVSSLPLPLVLVFGVVRAQLCEHARYPRTPLCFLVFLLLFSLLLLPAFLLLSFTSRLSCYCGMAVGGSPCVSVLCWHDCDG